MDPTPRWRKWWILTGFLMTNLDELWNPASSWYFWLIKMIIKVNPIHEGSNSRMEDWVVLDRVPNDESWWNLKHSFFMIFLTHLDDLTRTTPSMKHPTPGWRMGWFLTGFLMTNLDEIWKRASSRYFWHIRVKKMINPFHKGSNSRIEDKVVLERVPDV